jgi:4-hydroxybutyrate CoA-transferase
LTHDAARLADIDGLCAINAALQVDLLGNVNAECVGGRRISLPGGLPDFAAGARRAKGGMSIIALRSSYGAHGDSNIVVNLDANAPTSVGLENVDFVVTEYGVAALRGLTALERPRALIAVARPEHRAALEKSVIL